MVKTPYTLADIPQDITGSVGQVLTADVCSVTGTKKRKKSEIAVAIDRQGINIYNLKTSKLATSYAVSPQAVFTCPPCSIRLRTQVGRPPQRLTYCSVALPKPQIICFSELAGTRSNPTGTVETSSIRVGKHTGPIAGLEAFQIFGGENHSTLPVKLLITHRDGTVSCYTQDLSTEEWTTQISSNQGSELNLQIEYASVLSVEVARNGLLKGREDILGPLSAPGEEPIGSLLLVIVRSTQDGDLNGSGGLNLRIFSIDVSKPITQGDDLEIARKLRLLASAPAQEPSQVLAKKSAIAMHVASGTMYQNAEGILIIYDVTGFAPSVANKLELDQDPTSSYLRISSNLVACSNATGLSIVGLPYCSIQAECCLADTEDVRKAGKRTDENSQVQILLYSAASDLIIALHRRKLMAIQLSAIIARHGGSRKRKRDGMLVDSLGRAPSTTARRSPNLAVSNRKVKSLGTYAVSPPALKDWGDHKTNLHRYGSQNDAERFEEEVFSLLGVKNGDKLTLDSRTRSNIDHRGIYLILGTMFCVDESEQLGTNGMKTIPSILKIRFLPRRICNWLIERCFMTAANVEKSLKRSGALPATSKLAPGVLVRALAEWDSSLELLSTLIASAIPLGVRELVHALAIVTRDSTAAESKESPYLVTNGEVEGNDDEMQLQLTNNNTKQQPSSPPPTFVEGKHSNSILTTTLKRLYAIPSPSVAQALKTELSTPQLRILVDALRMEIAGSGWLSPYEDNLSPPSTDLQDNQQICHIAHLLNCAIDSIGTGGWILGSSINDGFSESADTIAYMKAEISAALEGIEEATYLKGMLGEILLCGKDTHQAQTRSSRPDEHKLIVPPVGPVTIALEETSNALPLGLKPAQNISTTKVAAGGELRKRSARDIGRQKSKMVGKYSFERIVI